MKKILIAFVIMMSGIISVNAAKLDIACGNDSLKAGSEISCQVNLSEVEGEITNIKFTVDSGDLTVTFNPSTGYTNNGTESNIDLTKVTAIANEKIGDLTINARANLSTGNKIVKFTSVKFDNNDGENVNKTINVTSPQSTDCTLKDIRVDGKTISGFSSNKTEYNIKVNKDTVTIDATANSAREEVSISGNNWIPTLVVGNNTFKITAKAENNDTKDYILNITYEIPKSSDNSLKTLDLSKNNGEKIEFTFDNKKDSFDLTLESDIDLIKINSTLNDEKATFVKDYGNRDVKLEYGLNKIEVRAQAENGSIKVYKLNITRLDNRSDSVDISTIIVNGKDVPVVANQTEYHVDVRYKYEQSDIEVKPTAATSSVEFENIDLVYGENEPIIIKVTAENGNLKEYKLFINRLSEEESKVTLQNIEVEGYTINFNPNIKTYVLNLTSDVNSLKFKVTPTEEIKVNILNNEKLTNGSTVIVRVTDDDGEHSYTFNIIKPEDKIFGIDATIFGLITLFIGLLSLTISCITVHNKKKKVREALKK